MFTVFIIVEVFLIGLGIIVLFAKEEEDGHDQ